MDSQLSINYSPRVKICGITRVQDLEVAVQYGAHALGFMVYEKSKRNVSLDQLKQLTQITPPFIAKVAVMVNPEIHFINEVIQEASIDYIQLHGDESPEFIEKIPIPVIKAFRVKNQNSLNHIENYSNARAWLLDSFVQGELGGTGHAFNWELANSLSSKEKPVILAGGLKPENICEAVRSVRPYGVDVSSGVESSPGIKCPTKLKDFLNNLRLMD